MNAHYMKIILRTLDGQRKEINEIGLQLTEIKKSKLYVLLSCNYVLTKIKYILVKTKYPTENKGCCKFGCKNRITVEYRSDLNNLRCLIVEGSKRINVLRLRVIGVVFFRC